MSPFVSESRSAPETYSATIVPYNNVRIVDNTFLRQAFQNRQQNNEILGRVGAFSARIRHMPPPSPPQLTFAEPNNIGGILNGRVQDFFPREAIQERRSTPEIFVIEMAVEFRARSRRRSIVLQRIVDILRYEVGLERERYRANFYGYVAAEALSSIEDLFTLESKTPEYHRVR
uniref:Uncharacterized protein n=1 Tax=Panagrolaimus superbus TaxID=310955 RepID=A0A914YX80_9BILA